MTQVAARFVIGVRRLGAAVLMTAATLIGLAVSLWGPLVHGQRTLDPVGTGTLAMAVSLWPGVAFALLTTIILLGSDRDTGLCVEQRLVGVPLNRLRTLDLLCATGINVAVMLWSWAVATAVGAGSWIAKGRPIMADVGVSLMIPARTLLYVVSSCVLAAIITFAGGWSAKRSLSALVLLVGSFFTLLAVRSNELRRLVLLGHPLTGPWRLLYSGRSARLTAPMSTTAAEVATLCWVGLALVAGVIQTRPDWRATLSGWTQSRRTG